jgi:inward rectifier potassium channel
MAQQHKFQRFFDSSGFGTQVGKSGQRLMNRDGSFNTERRGLSFFQSLHIYHWLITMPWTWFLCLVFAVFLAANFLFAGIYYAIGTEYLGIDQTHSVWMRFWEVFFFSTQTFTTVGYGRVNPQGLLTGAIASIEALIGLLAFALATGLMYGRFARPRANIIFSSHALISPYKEGIGLMFRIVHINQSQVIDAEATVILSMVERMPEGDMRRNFYPLELERKHITFFTQPWTLVHPITEQSPIWGMNEEQFRAARGEIIILIKGYDDTFDNMIHARSSYIADEFVWNAKFVSIITPSEKVFLGFDIHRIDEFIQLPPA